MRLTKKNQAPEHSQNQFRDHSESVRNTRKLLKLIIKEPNRAPEELVKVWHNQSRFARFIGMSLNTLKDHAKEQGEGGWNSLYHDLKQARKEYDSYKNKATKPSYGSRAQLMQRVHKVKEENQNYVNRAAETADQLLDLLTICKRHAKRDVEFASKLETHCRRYDSATRLAILKGAQND